MLGGLVASEPVASSSAMRASRSRMKAPAIVSARRERALGQGRERRIADADLEEVTARARSRSHQGAGRARRDGPRRGGHRGRGPGRPAPRAASTRAGWLSTVAASTSILAKLVRPTWCSWTVDLPPAGSLVELHEQDLAGPILVEGDRLGRPG